MKIKIPLSIYTMQSISIGRKAFKKYLKVDVCRDDDTASLSICVAEKYNHDEKIEIINSFESSEPLVLCCFEFLLVSIPRVLTICS